MFYIYTCSFYGLFAIPSHFYFIYYFFFLVVIHHHTNQTILYYSQFYSSFQLLRQYKVLGRKLWGTDTMFHRAGMVSESALDTELISYITNENKTHLHASEKHKLNYMNSVHSFLDMKKKYTVLYLTGSLHIYIQSEMNL